MNTGRREYSYFGKEKPESEFSTCFSKERKHFKHLTSSRFTKKLSKFTNLKIDNENNYTLQSSINEIITFHAKIV